jgi:hypothetical protein
MTKGMPCPEWLKQKLREAMTGKPKSAEATRKMALTKIGNKYRLGKSFSDESRQKSRNSHLGKKVSEEAKQNMSKAQKERKDHAKGWKHTKEARERMSITRSGRKWSDESRAKLSATNKGKKRNWTFVMSEEQKEKIRKALTGQKKSAEARVNYSAARKKLWKSPEYGQRMAKAWGLKPNKPESLLIKLLDKLYPGQWKYTGDFSFVIDGKSPDFVNCNGQKKIIELFGDYWHRGENPDDRAAIFSPYGYETLVIWEHELKSIGSVTGKIRKFHEAA